MTMRRRTLLVALLLAPLPVTAAEAPAEFYVKLPPLAIEFWDAQGLFHMVNAELTAVFPAQASLNKKVADRIAAALSAMAWEDFAKGNPAATIKAVALDVLRKDPTGEKATEVLVVKLMTR